MRALFLIPVLLLAACDPGGWKSLDTGAQVTLRSIFVEAKDRIWVTGDRGTVLMFDGEGWVDTSTKVGFTGLDVPNMYGVAASTYETTIAGDRGIALSRREAVWSVDRSNTGERMLTMLRPTPSLIYSAGENGRVIRKRSGDDAWERVDINAPRGAKITGIWGNSESTLAFATDRGVVIESVGDGWVAQTVATETSTIVPLFGVWSSTRGADLIAVGLAGIIYRRAEAAVDWKIEETGSNADLYAIYGTKNDDVYAVGGTGTVLHYDGAMWSGVPSATSHDLFCIHGLADGSVTAAAGERGTVVILQQ